jgi:hypothetical protein
MLRTVDAAGAQIRTQQLLATEHTAMSRSLLNRDW